jgi:hypothetical protein
MRKSVEGERALEVGGMDVAMAITASKIITPTLQVWLK